MITTIVETAGIALITLGVGLLLGVPVGLVVLGGFALAASWRMTREGRP